MIDRLILSDRLALEEVLERADDVDRDVLADDPLATGGGVLRILAVARVGDVREVAPEVVEVDDVRLALAAGLRPRRTRPCICSSNTKLAVGRARNAVR